MHDESEFLYKNIRYSKTHGDNKHANNKFTLTTKSVSFPCFITKCFYNMSDIMNYIYMYNSTK